MHTALQVFARNGLPSEHNWYIINGDMTVGMVASAKTVALTSADSISNVSLSIALTYTN